MRRALSVPRGSAVPNSGSVASAWLQRCRNTHQFIKMRQGGSPAANEFAELREDVQRQSDAKVVVLAFKRRKVQSSADQRPEDNVDPLPDLVGETDIAQAFRQKQISVDRNAVDERINVEAR
jgi:hypothetical protein